METCCVSCPLFYYVTQQASIESSSEWLCGLETATRASINIAVRSKRIKFQYEVNYLFKFQVTCSYLLLDITHHGHCT